MTEKILVIKLGALGDMVQAMGPFGAIRKHHAGAKITLLTTKPYVEMAQLTGLFDRVWIDRKPRALALGGWLKLRRQLRSGKFDRVYDLQTSDRSSTYLRLFWPRVSPEWSGIAFGCSHPHGNPKRDFMHTIERQADQLEMAGVPSKWDANFIPSLEGLDGPVERFDLGEKFALLVPGGAAHRPEKRWPRDNFSALAGYLAATGVTPVLIGGPAEAEDLEAIHAVCPDAIDLCGKTSLLDIAGLARRAQLAVGNDTGPMHLIAAMGCKSVVLYSQASDPALCGQRGADVTFLRKRHLIDAKVDEVLAKLDLTANARPQQ